MNHVYNIVKSIIENGYIEKPYIGVGVLTVSSETQKYGLPAGAAVQTITKDSPAEAAGLQVNDIITKAAYALAQGFTTIQQVLHIASVALIAVLLVISLLIISNTVKLAMYDRRDEIAIMKMVGATNGFIRLPFMVEGFSLGMMGAVLAFGLEWVGYDALVEKISTVDALKLFTFVPFENLLVPMIIVFAAAGLFVGVVGSWTSIRKFMDV